MRIRECRYRLVCGDRCQGAAPCSAVVSDVDVALARAATRGGRILDAAHPTATGRAGRIEDPFGNSWVVTQA
ncbi:MAG: hypothetical protein ACK5MQ_14805 [Pikeienuella sp.]